MVSKYCGYKLLLSADKIPNLRKKIYFLIMKKVKCGKKKAAVIENKKITKSEFKKYLRDRNLTISDTMMMNAVNLFNNVMLKNILKDENNPKKISKKPDIRKKLTMLKKRVLKLKKKKQLII